MSEGRLKVLIVGGYGTFGGRLAKLLADEAGLDLLIAGRSLPRARAFCAELHGAARPNAVVFDRQGDVAAQLARYAPGLVVDASGPFQAYGEDPFGVVRACIEAGVDYLDLADATGFVAGVARLDALAKARGVSALTGVSTFPVLSSAAARRLTQGLWRVDSIIGGIAPSPFAGVGLNVIRAITAYAGKPVRLLDGGAWTVGYGLAQTLRYTIRPPGRIPLRSTLFSLVDVPDLVVAPAIFPGVRRVWMGAGPRPEALHRLLIGLAWLVRLRLLPSIQWLSPLIQAVGNRVRWGEHRGGMFVQVKGADAQGRDITRSWHLLAEAGEGPLIPSMAAAALIRRRLAGDRPAAGARAAAQDLELEDYEAMFQGRAVFTGVRAELAAGAPLYQRVLGDAWWALAPAIRQAHDTGGGLTLSGRADVVRGEGLLARGLAAMIGAPKAGLDVSVSVNFAPHGNFAAGSGGEAWSRAFAGRPFRSVQSEGRGRWDGLVKERFGLVTVGLACLVDDGRLRLVVRRWSLAGLVLPLWLAPGGDAVESEIGGVFRFDVSMRHPLTGLIVRYSGWLQPDTA